MKRFISNAAILTILLLTVANAHAQRQTTSLNDNWKFALGHALSFEKNFMVGTRYFNYLTKTGYGDGAAAADFDDRYWRDVSLPHDWAVEMPFAPDASHSHGYKAVGYKYPENSVGWYRRRLQIPQTDLGKKISLLFEGVFRNSEVWVNGFYLGNEQSGYLDFQYDITDYLNYGGENVVTVKADATLEEGWFYEGAGIYRNVWLVKTDPVHVAKDGIFATTNINGNNADLAIRAKILNEDHQKHDVSLSIVLKDDKNKVVQSVTIPAQSIRGDYHHEYFKQLKINNIKLWSPATPTLYSIEVTVTSDGKATDKTTTRIGFRTVDFTSDKGLFVNGQHIKIVGANIHQDFAGVGCAVTKPLQVERVKMLKSWGFNGIRTSHNPVNPDLLDVCDSLGMLVLEETRLEGINDYHKTQLRRMIERDRNHPCIIAWSVGNEEWQIESNIFGERITRTIQAYAKTIDSTRMYTVAVSGGCGYGSSESIELMGFNYLAQCDIPAYREKHPHQPGWLTEETSGCGTRGIYTPDSAACHIPQFDRQGGTSIERGYKFCMEQEWMAGLFYWTGFDYRGEPTPFSYPANGSYFGILDQCGFPKDAAYYILANNSTKPMVHLFPHWNHKKGDKIDLWAYSNCDEVELIINKKSLGKQPTPRYGHISWQVDFEPGTISVNGYRSGKLVAQESIATTDAPDRLTLSANKATFAKKRDDIILVTVAANDSKGNLVPDADNKVKFSITGPGQIIGVANGDPSSLENDCEYEQRFGLKINALQELTVRDLKNWQTEIASAAASDWRTALVYDRNEKWYDYHDTLLVIKAEFEIDNFADNAKFTLYSKSILLDQDIYVNDQKVASAIKRDSPQQFDLDRRIFRPGKNTVYYVGKKIRKAYQWDEPNTDPGVVGERIPEAQYSRSLFSGKALVVVKTNGKSGAVVITAKSDGMKEAKVVIK